MRKPAFLFSLFFLCLVVTISQVFVSPVRAIEPLTSPVTAFLQKIGGNITIKHIGWWHHGFFRFMPLDHITVTLLNLKTHETLQTQTDADGAYLFAVTKGMYKVMPVIDKNTADIVAPPLRIVVVNKHDKMHEDFRALDLP
jgi:hypothetical protein